VPGFGVATKRTLVWISFAADAVSAKEKALPMLATLGFKTESRLDSAGDDKRV